MNPSQFIPHIPESAPFSREQRAYLNGFLAGLFSRVPVAASASADAPAAKPLEPLCILFGSQTGNAETLAKRISKEAGKIGFAPTIFEMSKFPAAQLSSERHLLVITSTYGDGDPPDNAKRLWDGLNAKSAPRTTVRFSVCALGDTNYPKFCQFGKDIDARLEKLGGTRVLPRTDCDTDFESAFQSWLHAALTSLGSSASSPVASASTAQITGDTETDADAGPTYHRDRPYPASFIGNVRLNGPGSAKDTRHLAFALEDSGLAYETGDALGVLPSNCSSLVEEILACLGCSGEEQVPGVRSAPVSIREALTSDYDITKINSSLLQAVADRIGGATLKTLCVPGVNGELKKFLWGREVIDLLLSAPKGSFTPEQLLPLLRKLQPRLYSIASSPKAHPGEVHLCVGIVRYESLGRTRKGVCSTFLADRVPANSAVPVFIQKNKNFRPPADPEAPMIMVGPGTGIAPFRGFLHERIASGARGKTWLFFGDQRASTDFLYQDELLGMVKSKTLTRLDLAFSRDQEKKIYVQDRMNEHAQELFAWLESGASFYVCGDASRMAKDVDAALHQVIQTAGNRTVDQAAEYVSTLKSNRRYQRDVY